MKRTVCALLALITLLAALPAAWAEEAPPEGSTAPAASATEAPETSPEPTVPVEPTVPPEPTVPVEPAVQPVQLRIDDANVYSGMDRAYKDGYVPQVADGAVTLVLPLLASGELQGGQITVTPDLGDPGSSPIQYMNYQKTFLLADNPVNVTGEEGEVVQTVPSYLVRFDFPLRSDRQNGTYPIILEVRGTDSAGGQVIQRYNCFVTITDAAPEPVETAPVTPVYGGGGGMAVSPTEVPVSDPRVLVSRYEVSASPVMAGDDFTVTVALKNTSAEENVQNMLVTVSCEGTSIFLKNDTSTIFMGDLAAGGTRELELKFGTDRDAAAQRYAINLAMEFDDEMAMSMASSGSVTVEVAQPVEVELAPFTMPNEINAGETVQLSFQVMNLGRAGIFNARVELDVPGLSPSGSAFIGNMEPGTSATQSLNVFAGMKEGDDRYGWTAGKVRLIYEDAAGREYTQEADTSTNVKELVIATKDPVLEREQEEKEQAQKLQWWAFVGIGAAVIGVLAIVLGLRKRSASSPRHIKK